MNAVSIIGVVSVFGLVFLWLLAVCAERGVHPLGRVRQGFRCLPGWEKALILIFVSVWIAFAGTKDGTNGVDQVEGETNTVTQIEGGTNQMENGELRMENAGGDFSILRSPFSILHSNAALPGNAITGDDIERMFRIATTFDVNSFAVPTANAVTNADWRDYGGLSDSLRIRPEGWRFPFGNGTTTGLTVFENGDFRPNVKTRFFPRPFDANLSLVPRMNWGLLPNGGESVFWHEQTPSNSLVLTWHNALYNRDVNCPTNFQAELFADGRFDYRYPDRTVQYAPVFPFDFDDDGLENSVDPEPLVAGPDAHGTNAEWYNVVCSNVFAAVEGVQGVELAPRAVGVKTNAYYFVDVVAQHGPAPIYFNSSHPGRLGSPVVVAYGGVTNRVPLMVGATYSVTSDVPFTVAYTTNGFAGVTRPDGRNATVRWPLNFTFTEELSGTNRTYTVDVGPYNPGGTFEWRMENEELRMGAGEDGIFHSPLSILHLAGGACGCVSGNGNTVTFGCSSACTCGGNCLAVGAFSFEYAVFAVTGGVCRCGFDDPPPVELPSYDLTNGPAISVVFSRPSVIYEDDYRYGQDAWQPRRSTRVRLTISAYGGANGGSFTLSSSNLSKLAPVMCGPMVLPSSKVLSPCESYSVSFLCEGVEASVSEEDVHVAGLFVENGTAQTIGSETALTVVRVELRSMINPPDPECWVSHRCCFGIGEYVEHLQYPSAPAVAWVAEKGGSNVVYQARNCYQMPLAGVDNPLKAQIGSVVYIPLLEAIEPSGVSAREARLCTYGMPSGRAGGIGLLQKIVIQPISVSFSQLSVEEVPCDRGEIDDYFQKVLPSNLWTHTRSAGAGRWFAVSNDNIFGGEEDVFDEAAIAQELPRITPGGVLTNDTAFGWRDATMTWIVPFGWNARGTQGRTAPVGLFAEDEEQEFMVNADGECGVRKLRNQVRRSVDNRRYLNTKQVFTNEVRAVRMNGEE